MSAVRRTAVFRGSSCSSSCSTRRLSLAFSGGGAGCSSTTNSPRARWAPPSSQALRLWAGCVVISSNCLVNSRASVTGRSPSTARACANSVMRWGASSSTTQRGSAARCCTALARSACLTGKKPAKTKPLSALPLATAPATLSAAVMLLAPGSGTTRRPAARTAKARRAPGSLMPGVPASLTKATRWPACRRATTVWAASCSLCWCSASSCAPLLSMP